jgi:hypothetical protein
MHVEGLETRGMVESVARSAAAVQCGLGSRGRPGRADPGKPSGDGIMSKKRKADPRQLDLFGDRIAPPDQIGNAAVSQLADVPTQAEAAGMTDREDELIVFYRKLRKVGCALHYDRAADRLLMWGATTIPKWASVGSRRLRDRIVPDLLRLQYGVKPAVESEALDGGATLHRLPRRPERDPQLDPPVRYSLTGPRRQPSAG